MARFAVLSFFYLLCVLTSPIWIGIWLWNRLTGSRLGWDDPSRHPPPGYYELSHPTKIDKDEVKIVPPMWP
jgi:hypothetical protein